MSSRLVGFIISLYQQQSLTVPAWPPSAVASSVRRHASAAWNVSNAVKSAKLHTHVPMT